jgi:hypothetical protein
MYIDFKRTKKFSYIIPYRSSASRDPGFIKVLEWLKNAQFQTDFEIIIVEQDDCSKISFPLPENCKHIFVFNDSAFNKGWAINIGAKASKNNILVIADADVVMQYEHLYTCVKTCNDFDAVDPKGELIDLEKDEQPFVTEKPGRIGLDFCSAIYLIKKSSFLYTNGWDESLVGWGADDNVASQKVRKILKRTNLHFPIYHFFHTSENYEKKANEESMDRLRHVWTLDGYKLLKFYKKKEIGNLEKYKLMEIGYNNKKVADLVLKSLKSQTSLFVLRIGDGEMLYFDKDNKRAKEHCINTLNYLLSDAEIEKVKKDLNDSIVGADILGLPTQYHQQYPAWKRILSHYATLKTQRCDEWKCDKYCSIDLHYELLEDDCYGKILRETKRLVIVSSRDVKERLLLKFPNIESIEQHLIPGEQQYESKKNETRNFPEIIENIRNLIKSKPRKGELLLYGAGFVGKIIGLDFSNCGGVAIDIGSVFDSWVGKNTRGQNKGPESYFQPLL